MFERTGQYGHLMYLDSIFVIIDSVYSDRNATQVEGEFGGVADKFLDENTGTTPAGKLRMTLFRRYFWPNSISLVQTLGDLLRYSTVQRDDQT